MNSKFIFLFVGAFLFFLIFRFWFSQGILTGSDLPYFHKEIVNNDFRLYSWSLSRGAGFGEFSASMLWNYASQVIPSALFLNIGLNWQTSEKLLFFIPFLFISFIGSFFLLRTFIQNRFFILLGILIYATNTYILTLLSGGQVMITLSYSLLPFAVYLLTKKNLYISIKNILALAITVALLFLLDIRIGYLFGIVFVLYLLVSTDNFLDFKKIFKKINALIFIFLLVLLVHSFWILPIIKYQGKSINFGNEFTSAEAINYFSFAKFENTISLLHPNWPENIFGKVSFMQPEFLIIPILAYSSLLFLKDLDKEKKKNILFFAFLGLIGSFLAKGSSPPFGFIYIWIFEHVPGFIMFRDSTKFYVLIALSYSILIPFFLYKISKVISLYGQKIYKKFSENHSLYIVFLIFTVFWMFTIRQAVFGQLGGTFKPTKVPQEYVKLEKFLSSQDQFYRTFWIPSVQRFGFYSQNHPAITAKDFYRIYDNQKIINKLRQPENQELLKEASVKYIIIPFDSEGELFLKNRAFDEEQYQAIFSNVKKINWLSEVGGFGKVKILEIKNPKDHFWSPSKNIILSYIYINPTKYKLKVKNAKKEDLIVFSENFDSYWVAKNENQTIRSQQYNKLFNSFKLPKDGDYVLEVYYEPQKWVDVGVVISVSTVIVIMYFFVLIVWKERLRK